MICGDLFILYGPTRSACCVGGVKVHNACCAALQLKWCLRFSYYAIARSHARCKSRLGAWDVGGFRCRGIQKAKPADILTDVDYIASCTAKPKMSSVKDSLLGAPAEYSDYRAVSKERTVVTVEPSAYKVGRDDEYNGPGAGCVSFHEISYQVSSCFGKRKEILHSVR